jgi:hypothetical protein
MTIPKEGFLLHGEMSDDYIVTLAEADWLLTFPPKKNVKAWLKTEFNFYDPNRRSCGEVETFGMGVPTTLRMTPQLWVGGYADMAQTAWVPDSATSPVVVRSINETRWIKMVRAATQMERV